MGIHHLEIIARPTNKNIFDVLAKLLECENTYGLDADKLSEVVAAFVLKNKSDNLDTFRMGLEFAVEGFKKGMSVNGMLATLYY